MMLIKECVVVILAVTLTVASPFARGPKITLVDGPSYLYGQQENAPNILTATTTEYPDDFEESPEERLENTPKEEFKKRSALRFAIARRSSLVAPEKTEVEDRKFTPAISVGAVMNLRDFFNGLQSNVNVLESKAISPEEFRALSSLSLPMESFRSVSQYVEDSSHVRRPTSNAAYLHAIRMYRPEWNTNVRKLVEQHPPAFHGTNNFNPRYLWTGLG